ncbi:MAG: hypothetical protein JW928_05970 [Candidatus Aureabacteria bacterium]|nr:hypothetical protein [Candidatus Auribacterota bacterium]
MSKKVLSREQKRILDVNRNRVTEALRVVEDILRFSEKSTRFALQVKKLRHDVFKVFEDVERETGEKLIFYRDSSRDRGRLDDYDAINKNTSRLPVILHKNLRRACEGLRVCEEILKILPRENLPLSFKSLRFRSYDVEKKLELRLGRTEKRPGKSRKSDLKIT